MQPAFIGKLIILPFVRRFYFMGKVIDLTGQVFGRLTVLREGGLLNGRNMWWVCKCTCGNEKTIISKSLRRGESKSCGCLSIEKARERVLTHGCGSKGHESPEYIAWRAMIQRINSKSYHARHRYSKRGITICDRWRFSFENFLSDMGNKPTPKHSLDRHPNKNGNYEPSNCRWATKAEQDRNKGNNVWIEYDNKTMILSDWARYFGILPSSLTEMMKKKQSFKDVYTHYMSKKK